MMLRMTSAMMVSALCMSTMARAEESDALFPKGVVKQNVVNEKFADNCHARRMVPEFSGLASKAAEKTLNSAMKKIQGVDMKLTAKDCPPATEAEKFLYLNQYVLGRQVGSFVGIRFEQVDPKGIGHVTHDCRVFNLDDGSELKLTSIWNKASLPMLQEKFQAVLGADYVAQTTPEGLTEKTVKTAKLSPFCLDKDGIVVLASPTETQGRAVSLHKDELAKVFKKHAFLTAITKDMAKK